MKTQYESVFPLLTSADINRPSLQKNEPDTSFYPTLHAVRATRNPHVFQCWMRLEQRACERKLLALAVNTALEHHQREHSHCGGQVVGGSRRAPAECGRRGQEGDVVSNADGCVVFNMSNMLTGNGQEALTSNPGK